MQRRNLQTMGHGKKDRRERGAWAPFVGVALAVLTAGSLVVSSLVAQRTSLDGFSTRGATALAPSQDTPASITLPARGDATASVVTPDERPTATALLTLSPPLVDGSDDGAAASTDARADVATEPIGNLSSNGDLLALFDGGGLSLQFFLDGEGRAATQEGDGRVAKTKGTDKPKKAKKAGNNKKDAVAKKARGHGRSAGGDNRHRRPPGRGAQGSSHRSNDSNHTAASRPAHSSRPARAPRPQRAAKPKSPPAHSKAAGKRHDKDRRRGHGRD